MDVLEHPVDPAGVKNIIPARDLRDVSPDKGAAFPASPRLSCSTGEESVARVQPDKLATRGNAGSEAGEIGPCTAAGIEHPHGCCVPDNPKALLFDLPEVRDAGDQFETPVARVSVAG
jgi:hypothetical protein